MLHQDNADLTPKVSCFITGKIHSRTNLLYDYHNHLHDEGTANGGAVDADFWRAHSTQILDKIAENKQVNAEVTLGSGEVRSKF